MGALITHKASPIQAEQQGEGQASRHNIFNTSCGYQVPRPKMASRFSVGQTLCIYGSDRSCVSAPPATNVDLFACFAERLFKSSSISYLPCRRVASESLYVVGMPYAWSIDRTACRMFNRQNSQNNAILALNSIERPATFHRL